MSLVISVSGYLIFGTETEGNVLNNFPTDDVPASVARGLLAVTMVGIQWHQHMVSTIHPFGDESVVLRITHCIEH